MVGTAGGANASTVHVPQVQHPEVSAQKLTPHVTTARAVSFPKMIVVRRGDTLTKISFDDCHVASDWSGIYAANRSKIKDPNLIYPNEVLVLDCKQEALRPVYVARTDGDGDHDNDQSDAAVRVVVHTPRHINSVSHGALYYSFTGLENLWVSAGGPSWAESAAAAVAECESGGRSNAYNPSGATGLWQILGSVVGGNLYNPYVNALNAVAKFKASGDTWAQWVCKP